MHLHGARRALICIVIARALAQRFDNKKTISRVK
jgi:hypothetical protein